MWRLKLHSFYTKKHFDLIVSFIANDIHNIYFQFRQKLNLPNSTTNRPTPSGIPVPISISSNRIFSNSAPMGTGHQRRWRLRPVRTIRTSRTGVHLTVRVRTYFVYTAAEAAMPRLQAVVWLWYGEEATWPSLSLRLCKSSRWRSSGVVLGQSSVRSAVAIFIKFFIFRSKLWL